MTHSMTQNTITAGLICVLIAAGAADAGPLEPPPGPVAPTMKTLDQVEPRISIDPADAPIVINARGSYYLTGNIIATDFGESAIRINVGDVTLDLAGFMIRNSELGEWNYGVIIASGADSIEIRNGTIRGCVFDGVRAWETSGLRLFDLRLHHNGNAGVAQSAGDAVIDRCDLRHNNFGALLQGRRSMVTNTIASHNGLLGIRVGSESMVSDCIALHNGTTGISVALGSTVRSCLTHDNGEHGILTQSLTLAEGNLATSNGWAEGIDGGAGIYANGNSIRVDSNHMASNQHGLIAEALQDVGVIVFVRNSAFNNGTNYVIDVGSPIVGPITASAGGAQTNAWSNFRD